MNWETDVSKEARETMELMGNFGPVSNPSDRTIKGWVVDKDGLTCKQYLSADDLTQMAAHLIEVSDWLHKRAGSEPFAAKEQG